MKIKKKDVKNFEKKKNVMKKAKTFLVAMGLKNDFERYEKEQKDFSIFLKRKGIKSNI